MSTEKQNSEHKNEEQKQAKTSKLQFEDDDGYFNDFSHHVGSERLNSDDWSKRFQSFESDKNGSGNIRKSTEEFLKMKRDEFWDTHKESIEETRIINEAAEYHEQLQFMRQMQQSQQQSQKQKHLEQMRELQNGPKPEQLRLLLTQIEQAMAQLQLQYTQQTQILQTQFLSQPIVITLTQQLQQAMQLKNTQQITELNMQLQSVQKQFQTQCIALQQPYIAQIAQLQTNHTSVKQKLQSIIQLQLTINQNQLFFGNNNNIYTIQENETQTHMRPHIIDETRNNTEEQPSLTNTVTNIEAFSDNRPRNNSNISNKSSVKQRVTSQSISSQISNQSQSKSPQTNTIMSPSISPMKLHSNSSISSPPIQHSHHSSGNTRVISPPIQTHSFNHNNRLQSPVPILTTQSLPNSPLFQKREVRIESLAEISRVSMTPEFKAYNSQRKKTNKHKTNANANRLNRSLPNSPRVNKLRSKMGECNNGTLTPLILAHKGSPFNDTMPAFPDIGNSKNEEREISEQSTTVLTHTGTTNMEEKDSDSSSSEDSDSQSDRTTNYSRKDSHNSMYSYSSMSTVFTGVNDGMLLANNSVYLSNMISTEQYNKMEVINDIKSLWLQVFSIPALFTLIITIAICWLSKYSNDNNKLGALLLCVAIFNMCAHLMIKGMTSTLSSLCDELYNANCKPLIGIQLQKMMGFSLCVTIPLVVGMMEFFSYIISEIYANDTDSDNDDLVAYMRSGIHYLAFAVPALTMFYVFQRYLQGSHVLHVNGYVSCCLLGSIVIELGILITFECVPAFKSSNDIFYAVLTALIVAYWALFILFTVCINIYKLHSETFIFTISCSQIFSFNKWYQYLNNGVYRSLLLFCNFWYFDFMIVMAGLKGLNELIAFGVLCNIYHFICNVISASEFVAKSLIFRGLLHSNMSYARDSWKYTIFFSFFLSVISGGIFFLLKEEISAYIFSILSTEIESLINHSWLYLYVLIILNGTKYGLIGGAQAMGYIKLVSSINLFSFYIVTLPVYVWIDTLRTDPKMNQLHSIYCSILLGVCCNVLCLLIFRVFINWDRELRLFTFRAHNQAQLLQRSVEAVHIQLQKYKNTQLQQQSLNFGYNHGHYHRRCNHKHRHTHCKHHKSHTHSHRHHSHQKKKRHKTSLKSNKTSKSHLINIPLQSTVTSVNSMGSLNSNNANNFGRINVMPLGRQKTNETYLNSRSNNNLCLHCSLSSNMCKCNHDSQSNGFSYGESNVNNIINPNKAIYDRYYLHTNPQSGMRGNDLQRKSQMHMNARRHRRTFWGDLLRLVKRYCCCCLVDGCCSSNENCCGEWWYYCCGCCCHSSEQSMSRIPHIQYRNQNIINNNSSAQNLNHSSSSSQTGQTPYSNYHIDLNNNAKYKIIHEDTQPIQLGLNDGSNNNQNGNEANHDLKLSLMSSIGGANAEYLKHSLASQFDQNFARKQ